MFLGARIPFLRSKINFINLQTIFFRVKHYIGLHSGEEIVKYRVHCALGDKFLGFGMRIGMDVRFKKKRPQTSWFKCLIGCLHKYKMAGFPNNRPTSPFYWFYSS